MIWKQPNPGTPCEARTFSTSGPFSGLCGTFDLGVGATCCEAGRFSWSFVVGHAIERLGQASMALMDEFIGNGSDVVKEVYYAGLLMIFSRSARSIGCAWTIV